jgi:hypothetical protein
MAFELNLTCFHETGRDAPRLALHYKVESGEWVDPVRCFDRNGKPD